MTELRWQLILIPALILLIFTGLLEEVIFRGIMQYAALRNLGRLGLVYVAVVFAVLHLGYRSVLDVVFVFSVAMFFGWVTFRTGSILGVTLAHGMTNITLFLVFPFLLNAQVFPSFLVSPPEAGAQPGMLAPVVTQEATRPWEPPTATPVPPSPTPTFQTSPTPTSTLVGTPTPPPAQPTSSPVPSRTTTACGAPADWVAYIVRAEDTLYSLSQRLGVSVQALVQANCLTTIKINVGQVLYVPAPPSRPKASTRTPTPTSTSPKTIPSSLTPDATSSPLPSHTSTPAPTHPPADTPIPTESAVPSTGAPLPSGAILPTESLTPTVADVPTETSPAGGTPAGTLAP